MSTRGVASGEVRKQLQVTNGRDSRPWVAIILLATCLVTLFVCLVAWVAVRSLTVF